MSTASKEFLRQAAYKAPDLRHRAVLQWALDQAELGFDRGKARLDGRWESGRQRLYEAKWEAINHLDKYLLQFARGHRAARRARLLGQHGRAGPPLSSSDLARQQRRPQRIVKSKAMTGEEIHLNEALETAGVEVVETDLGEFIVQLRKEAPYHIVFPGDAPDARTEISDLFHEKLGSRADATARGADDDRPAGAARRNTSPADMGITGANFAIAETGMISHHRERGQRPALRPRCRKSMSRCIGIEKILPTLEDLALFLPMLATAGAGQAHHRLQHAHRRPAPARRAATARRSFTWCCSTTAAPSCWPTPSSATRCTASAAAPA